MKQTTVRYRALATNPLRKGEWRNTAVRITVLHREHLR